MLPIIHTINSTRETWAATIERVNYDMRAHIPYSRAWESVNEKKDNTSKLGVVVEGIKETDGKKFKKIETNDNNILKYKFYK